VTPWWAETIEAKVCARSMPGPAQRRWRVERLSVYVEHVCKRSAGCSPAKLLGYLHVLAGRESSMRPWKRSRLNPDIEANSAAWTKHRDKFTSNPAAANPDRWMTGLGYYGQNAALWLPRWDAAAPPEVLCGEVESSEAHLRSARDNLRRLERGADCDKDGEPDYWGSACDLPGQCRPSWYDVSRTNSGTVCPGDAEDREDFVRRARGVGLDPWAPVERAELGDAIPREGQDEVAADLRARMDALQ
jgi:hypothetical protein